jgi:protein AATF/BFR2
VNGLADFQGEGVGSQSDEDSEAELDGKMAEDGAEFSDSDDADSADDSENSEGDEDLDQGSDANSDDDDDDDEAAQLRQMMGQNGPDKDAKVRDLLKDTKSLTTTIANAAQSDVAKGDAVKKQRKTFDSLLNGRIRLQKAIISTNSMFADAHREETVADASVEAAETAALALLTNLTDLRATLDEARTGQKRKRTTFTSTTSSTNIWESIRASEYTNFKYRKATLEKWSTKTRGATATPNNGRLNAQAQLTLHLIILCPNKLLNNSSLCLSPHSPRFSGAMKFCSFSCTVYRSRLPLLALVSTTFFVLASRATCHGACTTNSAVPFAERSAERCSRSSLRRRP